MLTHISLLTLPLFFQTIVSHPTQQPIQDHHEPKQQHIIPLSTVHDSNGLSQLPSSTQNQHPIIALAIQPSPIDHPQQSSLEPPPSLLSQASNQGVIAKQSYGTITMHSPFLHESVKMDFSIKLAEPSAPTAYPFIRGASFRQLARPSEAGEHDVTLIQELSIFLLDANPEGILFRNEPESSSASGLVEVAERATITKSGKVVRGSVAIVLSLLDSEELSISEDVDDRGEDESNGKLNNVLLDREGWRLLVGLLRSTALTMKIDVLGRGKGLGELMIAGEVEGVRFDSTWKLWDENGKKHC